MKNLICFVTMVLLLGACKQKPQAVVNKPVAKASNSTVYLFPYSDTAFSWKKYEKQDSIVKQQFLAHHPPEFNDAYGAYFNDWTDLSEAFKTINAALHVLDVNNDGFDDIIFEGYSGGEPLTTQIYLKTLNGFKAIFRDTQTVTRLEFDNQKLSAIYITEPGCCAEYLIAGKIYKAVYHGADVAFKPVHYTAYYDRSKLPEKYFAQPLNFTTITDSAKLRTKPAINKPDTLYLGGEFHVGNDAGSIGKGSKGRAIAQVKDSKGSNWWFVELQPQAIVSGNVFYEKEEKRKAGKMGWINEQDLKIVSDTSCCRKLNSPHKLEACRSGRLSVVKRVLEIGVESSYKPVSVV